jgi:hypothetical protein
MRQGTNRNIRASNEKYIVLAKRHGVNRKTVAKWKARDFTTDERMGLKDPRAGLLTLEHAALGSNRSGIPESARF